VCNNNELEKDIALYTSLGDMNDIRRHLGAATTEDAARTALAANPTWAADLNASTGSVRSNLRTKVAKEYSGAVRDILLPKGKVGRPVVYSGNWPTLSGPARVAIDESGVLPRPLEEMVAADWTPKLVSDVADVIVKKYPSAASASVTLSRFRGRLDTMGVAEAVTRASARPEVTRVHNARIQEAMSQRVAEGFNSPPPFERIADLNARIDAYLAGAPLTGQVAADLLVALSARPGEAEQLHIGEQGGITGSLKKRGATAEMPLVTAVGLPRAHGFLARWQVETQHARRKAMGQLKSLTDGWKIQRRDLRAVGASLAVRAAALEGNAANEGQARDVHRAALRHEPAAAAAQDHYLRVNDPMIELCARLAELSAEDRARVAAIINTA
jgi:hypothetical protein